MKLLGLNAGRRGGNSEILLKEAMMAAEELGAEAELIRLHDLTIKPCLGCESCTLGRIKTGLRTDCVKKDDHWAFLLEKMGEADGIILSSPSYCFRPPGLLLMIRDRWAGIGETYYQKAAQKPKVGATIGVGGYSGISMMRSMTNYCLPTETKLVDQMLVMFTSRPGQVLLNDGAVARARKLGLNMAKAMKMPFKDVKYVGEEYGGCPLCHTDLLYIEDGKRLTCPTCYIHGKLEMVGDSIKFVPDQQEFDRRSNRDPKFAKAHDDHLARNWEIMAENKELIDGKMAKYKAYKKPIQPPPLKEK
jgi:multimeric flavodoxin WrbA